MAIQKPNRKALHAAPPGDSACACGHIHSGPEQEALQRFDDAYLLWKAVTVRYEHEMLLMNLGDTEAYPRVVTLVQDMAHAHHEFLRASQPLFRACRERTRATRPASSFSGPPAAQRTHPPRSGHAVHSTHL